MTPPALNVAHAATYPPRDVVYRQHVQASWIVLLDERLEVFIAEPSDKAPFAA